MQVYEIHDRISNGLRRTLRELFFSILICAVAVGLVFGNFERFSFLELPVFIFAGLLLSFPAWLIYRLARFAVGDALYPTLRIRL